MKARPVDDNSACTLRISIADMVSLKVRTRGLQNLDLPQVLYQGMPVRAMALMATIPNGPFAVSIPGAGGLARGHAILKSPPPSTDRFVIVYARKTNGRYEAATVQHQGRAFEISEFIEIACDWVAQHTGRLKSIPGRYAFFVPDREEWGVILRDSGYVGWDTVNIPPAVFSELRERLQAPLGSGIIARVPFYAGDRQPPGEALPVFTQVEITLESDPSSQSAWMSFAEYQKLRAIRLRVPDSIISDFHAWLSRLTEESGFTHWIFRPGMLFGNRIEWWGDLCRRRTEHEGVDFAEGFKPGTGICSVPEGTPVRSIANGEVVAMLDDYIGKTIVVRHSGIIESNGDVFHTLLSHIKPLVQLSPVAKGQILGHVDKLTSVRTPAHLHLTGAWIPKILPSREIRLDLINPAFDPVALVDFKDLMQGNSLCSCITRFDEDTADRDPIST